MNTAQRATLAAAELRELAPRARARTLTAPDIARAIRLHLQQCRLARKSHPDAKIITQILGGHVPSSYMGQAYCDAVSIVGAYSKSLVVTVDRKYAQQRSYGAGSTLLVRRKEPHHSKGAIVLRR